MPPAFPLPADVFVSPSSRIEFSAHIVKVPPPLERILARWKSFDTLAHVFGLELLSSLLQVLAIVHFIRSQLACPVSLAF